MINTSIQRRTLCFRTRYVRYDQQHKIPRDQRQLPETVITRSQLHKKHSQDNRQCGQDFKRMSNGARGIPEVVKR